MKGTKYIFSFIKWIETYFIHDKHCFCNDHESNKSDNSYTQVGRLSQLQGISQSEKLLVYHLYTLNSSLVTCTQVERVLVIISRNCDTDASARARALTKWYLVSPLAHRWLINHGYTCRKACAHCPNDTLGLTLSCSLPSWLPFPAHTPHTAGLQTAGWSYSFPNNLASVMKTFALR